MVDLLAHHKPPATLAEQIACVEREIKMRERVYPRWVQGGRMAQEKADYELTTMKTVLASLKALQNPRR